MMGCIRVVNECEQLDRCLIDSVFVFVVRGCLRSWNLSCGVAVRGIVIVAGSSWQGALSPIKPIKVHILPPPAPS